MEYESKEKYFRALQARVQQYADRVSSEDLRPEFAAYEILSSIFSAYEGGIPEDSLTEAYPIEAWRNDQLSIPRGLLRPIVEGWLRYRPGNRGVTLGEAMRLEGGGQGKRPVVQQERGKDRERMLANKVLLKLLVNLNADTPISQEAAFQAVAEEEGAGFETVRAAYGRFGRETKRKLAEVLPLVLD